MLYQFVFSFGDVDAPFSIFTLEPRKKGYLPAFSYSTWEGSILFDVKSSCHLTVDPMKDSDEFGIDSYNYTYIETLAFVNNVVSI